MHIMSILCSTAAAVSSGSCPILFKVPTLNVAICIVCLHFSSFYGLSSVAEVGVLLSVFKKSATELKQQKLLKCKQTIQIATFNIRTLNRIGQLPELTASAIEHKIDRII